MRRWCHQAKERKSKWLEQFKAGNFHPGKRATLFGRASAITIGLRTLIWKDVFYSIWTSNCIYFFSSNYIYYIILYCIVYVSFNLERELKRSILIESMRRFESLINFFFFLENFSDKIKKLLLSSYSSSGIISTIEHRTIFDISVQRKYLLLIRSKRSEGTEPSTNLSKSRKQKKIIDQSFSLLKFL